MNFNYGVIRKLSKSIEKILSIYKRLLDAINV